MNDDYKDNVNTNGTKEEGTTESSGTKGKIIAGVIAGVIGGIGVAKTAGHFIGKKAKSVKKKHNQKEAAKILDEADQYKEKMLEALDRYNEFKKEHPEVKEDPEQAEEPAKKETKDK